MRLFHPHRLYYLTMEESSTTLNRARNAGQPAGPRVCVVTGGSRGIGKSVCLTLAKQNVSICVNYTSESSKILAEAVVADCLAAGSPGAIAFRADVSQLEQISSMFDSVISTLGLPTALVNNAAIIGEREGLLETKIEVLQRIMEVNVYGPLLCTQEFVRRVCAATKENDEGVVEQGRGAIVNVSSGSAFIGQPLAYAMTKGALNSFSAGVVSELASMGIRLNSVSPGLTRTEMVTDEMVENSMGSIPMRRGAEPSEIADVISFLLSDAASFVSGGNLRVAGGRPMGGSQ